MLNYYYVIFGSDYDYYVHSYSEIFDTSYSDYHYNAIDSNNKLLNKVCSIHYSDKVNSYVNIPFKRVWNKYMTGVKKNDCKKICFLFFPGSKRFKCLKYGFGDYLRTKYVGCRLVCFYQDLVQFQKTIPVEQVKEMFDLVLSFDQDDCEKYGLIYHQLVYTSEDYPISEPEYDVYFVGQAKNRINQIFEAYEYLMDNGLKCDFSIVGAKDSEMKYKDSIAYRRSMPYDENIRHTINSKAMLEIMQQGGKGFTLRTCEAIAYDRMLITNNTRIHEAEYYDPNVILQFSSPKDIDTAHILNTKPPYDYRYKTEITPRKLLEFVDELLK